MGHGRGNGYGFGYKTAGLVFFGSLGKKPDITDAWG
jgi:hypothetical protein